MLKSFSVQNFKNFKEQFILDFSDVHDYKFNTTCIKNKLIKTAIIYGKNGTGKTNLGLALFDIIFNLTNKEQNSNFYDNYLNVDNNNQDVHYKTAKFKYNFKFSNQEITYYYEKADVDNLTLEGLYINEKQIFEYDFKNKKWNVNNLQEIDQKPISLDFRDISISIVRYIVNNSNLKKTNVLKKLMLFVDNMLWFRSLRKNHYMGFHTDSEKINDYIINNGYINDFEDFLKKYGIQEKISSVKLPTGENRLYFKKKHGVLPWSAASNGTQALFLFYYWYKHIKDVSFLFIDEFDAFYHHELAEKIVQLLQSSNIKAQSILTTHNTNLLSNNIMRPDCYFILTDKRISSIANATTRELREGHNLEKLFISGEFNG